MITPICVGCEREPDEIGYDAYTEDGETADEYVRREEGTYNFDNGHFWCDECYIRAGQPLGTAE